MLVWTNKFVLISLTVNTTNASDRIIFTCLLKLSYLLYFDMI